MKIEFNKIPNPNVRHISLMNVQEIFFTLEEETGWGAENRKMRYGFYFVDASQAALLKLADELSILDYSLVGIRYLETECVYQLQLEILTQHTPESIHQLMQEFIELAYKKRLIAFDGWDIAPIEW